MWPKVVGAALDVAAPTDCARAAPSPELNTAKGEGARKKNASAKKL